MKVALVHDYLMQDGGAERVLLALHELYPSAPVYTLFYAPELSHPAFHGLDIRPSVLNRWPFAKRRYQWFLPLMPAAVEAFDLSEYDLVISNSSSFAKGVIVGPRTRHICYCHTPTRFLWQDRVSYVEDLPQAPPIKSGLRLLLHRLRQWDHQAAQRPDAIVTNSRTSASRIRRYYHRPAHVIHPPVDVAHIPFSTVPGAYWLTGGRLVGYKRFDLAVKAFAKLNLPLVIFGDGPERTHLQALAGSKTRFMGYVDDAEKLALYQHALGFIYPQEEDFGLTAVEAMACGKPVLAYGRGGATETILQNITGQFFERQCWEDIAYAIMRLDLGRYVPERIRQQAERFSKTNFLAAMRSFIEQQMQL